MVSPSDRKPPELTTVVDDLPDDTRELLEWSR